MRAGWGPAARGESAGHGGRAADLPRHAQLPGRVVGPDHDIKPVDADDVAARLAELALGASAGQVPDMGGPRVVSFAELVRAYVRASGKRRWVAPVRLPATGAFRDGVLVPAGATGSGSVAGQRTWEAFLVERLD